MKTARNQTEACCAINTLCVCVRVCYCEHLFLFVSQDRVWFITNTDIKFWSRAVNYCPVFQRVGQQNNRRLLIIEVIRQSEDTVLQNFREALSCYRVESRRSDMRALIKDERAELASAAEVLPPAALSSESISCSTECSDAAVGSVGNEAVILPRASSIRTLFSLFTHHHHFWEDKLLFQVTSIYFH